jgi:hypothetical protein
MADGGSKNAGHCPALLSNGVPKGIRTPNAAVKGPASTLIICGNSDDRAIVVKHLAGPISDS